MGSDTGSIIIQVFLQNYVTHESTKNYKYLLIFLHNALSVSNNPNGYLDLVNFLLPDDFIDHS